VPLAILVLASRDGGRRLGLTAIVLAQTFAFLPHAFALVMRALAGVSAEAEQARSSSARRAGPCFVA
jgi:ABC-type Fe3+ transport system permease subunit